MNIGSHACSVKHKFTMGSGFQSPSVYAKRSMHPSCEARVQRLRGADLVPAYLMYHLPFEPAATGFHTWLRVTGNRGHQPRFPLARNSLEGDSHYLP